MSEAGYEIVRNEEKNDQGHRGYSVTFPTLKSGDQPEMQMRRFWLTNIAESILEGARPQEIYDQYKDKDFNNGSHSENPEKNMGSNDDW